MNPKTLISEIRGWIVIIIDLGLLLLILAAVLTKYNLIRVPLPSLPPMEMAYLAGAVWLSSCASTVTAPAAVVGADSPGSLLARRSSREQRVSGLAGARPAPATPSGSRRNPWLLEHV